MVLQSHVTNKNHHISVTRVSMATKLGRMIPSLDGLLPIMLHDPLITWPSEMRDSLTGGSSACKRLSCHQLLVFLLVTFSGWTAGKLFNQRFMISYQESMWPRSDSFLGHTKISFYKYYSTSCYSRRIWHMTQLMYGNQNSKHPKKHKKQSAKNSETSYLVDGRRFKGQYRDKSSW